MKINELITLKRNAMMLGLCGVYKDKWDEAKSRHDLFKLSMDANGVEFMADGFAFGWGLTKEFVLREFGVCINGRSFCEYDGYDSEMFVGFSGDITLRTTITLVVGCDNLDIHVRDFNVNKLYVCGGSNIRVICNGVCLLKSYGKNNIVEITENGGVIKRKDVLQSEWNNSTLEGK